jgi:hypothetical protein
MKTITMAGALLLAGCTSIQSQIEINAPAKAVRAVLYKFDDYPNWNPFIKKVDGTVAEGKDVTVTVKPVGKDQLSGTTTIISMTDNRLEWRGSLAIPGLFTGDHEFIIEELDSGRTLFRQNEKMSGIIIPFFNIEPEKAGFAAMNAALKQKAEARSN